MDPPHQTGRILMKEVVPAKGLDVCGNRREGLVDVGLCSSLLALSYGEHGQVTVGLADSLRVFGQRHSHPGVPGSMSGVAEGGYLSCEEPSSLKTVAQYCFCLVVLVDDPEGTDCPGKALGALVC